MFRIGIAKFGAGVRPHDAQPHVLAVKEIFFDLIFGIDTDGLTGVPGVGTCRALAAGQDPSGPSTPVTGKGGCAAASVLAPKCGACARGFPQWATSWGCSGVQIRSPG